MFKNLINESKEHDQDSDEIIQYSGKADKPIYDTLKEMCIFYPYKETERGSIVTQIGFYEFTLDGCQEITINHVDHEWLPILTINPDEKIDILQFAKNIERELLDIEEVVKLYKLNEKLCQSLATKAEETKPTRLKI